MGQRWLRPILGICVVICVTAAAVESISAGAQDKGAADMVLEGGSSGDVPFPHRRHQESLTEGCQVCHDMFPQKRGSIEALKAEGNLESKQVMNRLCTACHRQYRREGVDTGPITCGQCHQR